MSTTTLDPARYAIGQRIIYALSAVICVVVALLIGAPRPAGLDGSVDVSALPMVNAGLNATTMVLLIAGFVAIKLRQLQAHKLLMSSAFATSTLFLVTYVVYHFFKAGPAVYEGGYRAIYLGILVSHILLSVVILPLALTTLFRGAVGAIGRHKAIAPITLALWLYVSVTGVLIWYMAHG